MARKPTIVVVIDGGLLQGVLTDGDVDAFDVISVDYDTDGGGYSHLNPVPQDDGATAGAICSATEVEQCSPAWVDEIRHGIDHPVAVGELDD